MRAAVQETEMQQIKCNRLKVRKEVRKDHFMSKAGLIKSGTKEEVLKYPLIIISRSENIRKVAQFW
jgi:hypothetical protein